MATSVKLFDVSSRMQITLPCQERKLFVGKRKKPMDLRKQLDEEQCIAWGVYSEDWTSWGITAEKADATFLLRTYEDYGRARDFAESFSPHAVPLQRVVPTTSACFDKPTWRKAFQYGVPEIRAKFPGVSIESVTIRHQSGATIEACHSDAIFTFQGKSTISQNNEGIDRLLLEYGLPDVGWELAPDNEASVTPL